MAKLDSRNTTRQEDWDAFVTEAKKFPRGRIGHKFWNMVVEELRRHGYEMKAADHSYRWPWDWKKPF